MGWNQSVTYKGYRTREGWEIVAQRPGQRLRLLDLPRHKTEWALGMLTDYLGDKVRAENLHHDFSALTIRRLTGNWELSDRDIEDTLTEVEILRARLRIVMARG